MQTLQTLVEALDLELDGLATEATSLSISDDIQSLDDGIFGDDSPLGKIIVQPVQGNFSYSSIKNQRVEAKRSSTVDITYGLSQNISGYDVYFGVKENYRDEDFAIAEKNITSAVTDFSTGTGIISLTASETDISDGDYIGELKLVEGDTVVRPIEFRLRILPSILS